MKITYLFFLILPTVSLSQFDPLSLAETIFARDTFPELEQHITGSYKGHPNGTDLNGGTKTEFLLLGQDNKTAVVNINFSDSTGISFDCYLHFIHDEVWKANAFRSLAMMKIPAKVKEELELMSDEEIDQLVEDSKNGTSSFPGITSREDYDYELGNLTLMLSTDQTIVDHFEKNRDAFNRVKDQILSELGEELKDESSIPAGEHHSEDLRKLLLSFAKTGGLEFGETLNFSIGGMLDNAVGYLFIPDNKSAPKMNPNRIIMIRNLGNGWYMYKTT
ncbi:MAG: hypothetical protein AB8B56_19600 [Crocinitomicaceae bacterium]